MLTTRVACFLLLALLAGAPHMDGQAARRSQRGTVTQMISTTAITVAYNRPSARGRSLFGGVVPHGTAWNPGADEATTLTASKPIRVAGQPLSAGTYSLWMIPTAGGPWTVIFSKAANVFHVPYPEGRDALRVRLAPQRGCFVETLAFYFPVVGPDSAVLTLHWGETIVPIPIALN